MSPISDNRNLSSDKPIDPKKIEQENSYARYGQKRESIDRYREGGVKPSTQSESDPQQSQPEPQGFVDSQQEKTEPGGAFGTEGRPDIFSSMRRPKTGGGVNPELPKEVETGKGSEDGKEAPSEQKTAGIGDNVQEKKTQKAASSSSTSKVEKKKAEKPAEISEPVKTVFGNKDYVDKKLIKYNLWKSDDLRNMTKLGRNDRASLAQEFFPDRRQVRKEDVKRAIRGIESGKIKPPESLGSGRTGRIRTTNVLRKLIGEKPKKIY